MHGKTRLTTCILAAMALLVVGVGVIYAYRKTYEGVNDKFVDDFARGDTEPGWLSGPEGWSPYRLLGPYNRGVMPPATDGQIKSRRFVAKAGAVVYAVREFPHTISRVEGSVVFDEGAGSGEGSTAALIVSPNAKIVEEMIHVIINRSEVRLEKRLLGDKPPFFIVARTKFNKALAFGARVDIKIHIDNGVVTLNVGEVTLRGEDEAFKNLAGRFVCWEIYQPDFHASDTVSFLGVSAE